MRRGRTRRYIALLAVASSLAITIGLWQVISGYQEMWPLPALYLLEMVLLTAIAAFIVFLDTRAALFGCWAITGAISAFAILGAFSIGFAYIPVVLLVAVATLLGPNMGLKGYIAGITTGILAGAAQAGVMLAAIRGLYPGAAF